MPYSSGRTIHQTYYSQSAILENSTVYVTPRQFNQLQEINVLNQFDWNDWDKAQASANVLHLALDFLRDRDEITIVVDHELVDYSEKA